MTELELVKQLEKELAPTGYGFCGKKFEGEFSFDGWKVEAEAERARRGKK